MPGIDQLPPGAEGAAALSFTYSSISLICSALLLWLTVIHREGWSYVYLLCISTGLSTIASLSQQIHDTLYYEDVLREQFRRKTHFFDSPELAIANGSYGVDLVLYWFQYWSYNVQALLVMFWAGELAQSVYGLSSRPKMRHILRRINIAGKAISFVFPAITILTLRASALHANFFAFILLADLPLMISLAVGSITMALIVWRYIKTKKGFTHWKPPPSGSEQNSKAGTTISTTSGARTTTSDFSATQYSNSAGAPRSSNGKAKSSRRQGMYDRWLLVRFFVSFGILAVFEVTNILFQMQSIRNLENDSKLTEPDLSVGRANTTYFLFLPGVTAGIFLFIVFGTTAGCRAKMRETFVPNSLEHWLAGRRQRKDGGGDGGGGGDNNNNNNNNNKQEDDLEYNYSGVMEAGYVGGENDYYSSSTAGAGGPVVSSSPGKGKIMRSSSVTVTYTNSSGRRSRMNQHFALDDGEDYKGEIVALDTLPPTNNGTNKNDTNNGSAMRKASDDTFDDEYETGSEAMIVSPASALSRSNSMSKINNNNNSSTLPTTTTTTTATTTTTTTTMVPTSAFITYSHLMKPLPVPTDSTMSQSRIAHFQAVQQQRRGRSMSIPEIDIIGGTDTRRFPENHQHHHQRRQIQQTGLTPPPASQQQQKYPQKPSASILRRQWSQGGHSRNSAGAATAGGMPAMRLPEFGEDYYGSSPEHSDDSGPILPIQTSRGSAARN